MRNNCVAFGSCSSLFFAVATAIIGLEKYSSQTIDAYVVFYDKDDPILDNDKDAIQKITRKVVFKEYLPPENISLEKSILDRYKKIYLAKFQIFSLLKEYEKVLWLDSDVCIQGDISALFELSYMAWRPNKNFFYQKVKEKAIAAFAITHKDTRPNGGLVFVSRDIEHYDNLTQECYELMFDDTLLPINRNFNDEVALALVQKKFSIPVTLLDDTYNANILWDCTNEALIVHSVGSNKFWNNAVLFTLYSQWKEYYQYWESLGGSLFSGKFTYAKFFGKTKASLYRSIMNDQYWKPIIKDLQLDQRFSLSDNTYNTWVNIYINSVNRTIYYKLLKKNNICFICLRVEHLYLEERTSIESVMKKCCEKYNVIFEKTDTMISIKQKLDKKKNFNEQVHFFIGITEDIVNLVKTFCVEQ